MSNVVYTVRKIEQISEEFQKQIKHLNHISFGHEVSTPETEAEHQDRYYNLEKFMYIFALEGDTIISKVGLIKRSITYGGKQIMLGGFGGVCTLPEKQRQGIASALVPIAMEELKKAGCDIAYLCTDVNDASKVRLYKKGGFVVYGKPHTYNGKSGKLYTDHDAMIAPVNSRAIFYEVMNGVEPLHLGNGNW